MQLLKRTKRPGLTIVEMLVACALAIFLMAVLSEAFVTGLRAFHISKGMADMDQQLRQTTILLRSDLKANHFEGDLRLRDVVPGTAQMGYFQIGEGFRTIGGVNIPATWFDGTNWVSAAEGGDPYSVAGQLGSTRDVDDWLACTVRLNGNRPENYFYGLVPAGSPLDGAGFWDARWDAASGNTMYASQWVEVVWFLRPDPLGLTTEAPPGMLDAAGNPLQRIPLYQLFRRQRLLVPDNFATGTTGLAGSTMTGSPTTTVNHSQYDVAHYKISNFPNPAPIPPNSPTGQWKFTSPADIQFPVGLKFNPAAGAYQWDFAHRFQPIVNPLAPGPNAVPEFIGFPRLGYAGDLPAGATIPPGYAQRGGADLILNNVLSFDIKVWDPFALGGQGAFVDLGFGTPPATKGGNWTPTSQAGAGVSPADPRWRPFGRPPVQLLYPAAGGNVTHASQRLYTNAWVYDTWTRRLGGGDVNHVTGWNFKATTAGTWAQEEPYPAAIQAIQIKIRVWDRKTNQTREVTIIQDM